MAVSAIKAGATDFIQKPFREVITMDLGEPAHRRAAPRPSDAQAQNAVARGACERDRQVVAAGLGS
jgi:FixJ family two-component response regulator